MAFESGRLQLFVDNTTAKDAYTNETYDSMTVPLVNQLCDIFGMHIITTLTQSTAKGRRFFIGFSDDDPKFMIGWAVNNTYTSAYFLLCVGCNRGNPIVTTMDTTSSSSISSSQYCTVLLAKTFDSQYYFMNYVKDTNIAGIGDPFKGSSPTITNSNGLRDYILKMGTKKFVCFAYQSNSYVDTYDYDNNGYITRVVDPGNVNLKKIKNWIANSDFEYIAQVKLDHGGNIDGLFVYSRNSDISINKIYNINGEYYFCIATNTNDGSWLVKINYTPA